MARTLRSIRGALFTGSVTGALLFGAITLRAEARVPACNDPFANGSCSTQSGCAKSCQFNYGAGTGSCSNYCCYCIWF